MSDVEIRGIFLGMGVECPQFMIDSGEQVSLIGKRLDELTVYFHAKVSRFFHREVSHLQVMFLSSCWRQDISWVLPFSGHSG